MQNILFFLTKLHNEMNPANLCLELEVRRSIMHNDVDQNILRDDVNAL